MAAMMAQESNTSKDLFDACPLKHIGNVKAKADGDTLQETNIHASFSEPSMAVILAQENNNT
jgi:hypothetical protein